jgi:hypothetical protein
VERRKTRNVVFVHGLFADGSCWSKVIARLQQKGRMVLAALVVSEFRDKAPPRSKQMR